jgi:hypothetical protein
VTASVAACFNPPVTSNTNPDLDWSVQPQRPTLSQDLREPQEILWVTFFRDATRLITLTKPV